MLVGRLPLSAQLAQSQLVIRSMSFNSETGVGPITKRLYSELVGVNTEMLKLQKVGFKKYQLNNQWVRGQELKFLPLFIMEKL